MDILFGYREGPCEVLQEVKSKELGAVENLHWEATDVHHLVAPTDQTIHSQVISELDDVLLAVHWQQLLLEMLLLTLTGSLEVQDPDAVNTAMNAELKTNYFESVLFVQTAEG